MIPRAPGSQSMELLDRLQAWGVSSWRHGDRIAVVRSTLDRLAALATAHDGLARPTVPDAGVHALADQLAVLAGDARRSGAGQAQLHSILQELAIGLGLLAS